MVSYSPYNESNDLGELRKADEVEKNLLKEYFRNKEKIKELYKANECLLRDLPLLTPLIARFDMYDSYAKRNTAEYRTFIIDKPKTFIVMNKELEVVAKAKTTKADLTILSPTLKF